MYRYPSREASRQGSRGCVSAHEDVVRRHEDPSIVTRIRRDPSGAVSNPSGIAHVVGSFGSRSCRLAQQTDATRPNAVREFYQGAAWHVSISTGQGIWEAHYAVSSHSRERLERPNAWQDALRA